MPDPQDPREPNGGPGSAPASPSACASCGAVPDGATALLTWSRGTEDGREVWTCGACSRQHLRSIEGKLDSAWW